MSWLLLACITAVSSSFRDVFVRVRSNRLKAQELAIAQYCIATSVLSAYCLLSPKPFLINSTMLSCAAFAGISVAIGTLLVFTSLEKSEVSLMIPLRALTPVLILLLSLLALQEEISGFGILGVLGVAFGIFIVNNPKYGRGLFAEFAQAKGTPYMLGGAVVFSFCAISEKIGILHSDALQFTTLECLFSTLSLLLISKLRLGIPKFQSSEILQSYLPIGALFSITIASQNLAYQAGPISYVVAIKRSGTVISVLLGCWLLREGGFQRRFLGVCVVALSAALLAFKG